MNLNSDDYYSRKAYPFSIPLVSDGERVKGVRSPSPKAGQFQEQTFVKDEPVEHTDHYIDDMKKGTSNILVIIIFSLTFRSPCG